MYRTFTFVHLLAVCFALSVAAVAAQNGPTTSYVVISNLPANARACPGPDCAVVATFALGAVVSSTGTVSGDTVGDSDQWAQISDQENTVYVHQSLLDAQIAVPGGNVPTELGATAAATQSEATATVVPPAATEEPAAGPKFTVSGTVTNGTAHGTVPADLVVSLFIFPQVSDPIQVDGTIDADNRYTFLDVQYADDAAYAVAATYLDRLFVSEIVQGTDLNANHLLDLSIYELTDDPTVLTISLIETQITVNESSNSLEVAQFIEVENSSDRAYTTTQTTPDGRPIGLAIPLPTGSIVPGFDEKSRYVYLADQFTMVDTQSVLPGEIHLVQLVYSIPYEGSAFLEQELSYTFNGLDQLLVRPQGVSVNAEGLASMGTMAVGGHNFMSISGTLTRPVGSVLRIELTGWGTGGPSSTGTASASLVLTPTMTPAPVPAEPNTAEESSGPNGVQMTDWEEHVVGSVRFLTPSSWMEVQEFLNDDDFWSEYERVKGPLEASELRTWAEDVHNGLLAGEVDMVLRDPYADERLLIWIEDWSDANIVPRFWQRRREAYAVDLGQDLLASERVELPSGEGVHIVAAAGAGADRLVWDEYAVFVGDHVYGFDLKYPAASMTVNGPLIEAIANSIRVDEPARQLSESQIRATEEAQFMANNADVEDMVTTKSGLRYRVMVQGDGPRPNINDVVIVHHTGMFLDGTVFDSSVERGQPISFPLDEVIAGWAEGVQLMPVGSTYQFWIPPDLAYGSRGPGGVISPAAGRFVIIFLPLDS